MFLQTHKIKKFIMHTNYPGHADFNSYIKCNFIILGSDCKVFSCCNMVFSRAFRLEWWTIFLSAVAGTSAEVHSYKNKITPNTKWEQVKVKSFYSHFYQHYLDKSYLLAVEKNEKKCKLNCCKKRCVLYLSICELVDNELLWRIFSILEKANFFLHPLKLPYFTPSAEWWRIGCQQHPIC